MTNAERFIGDEGLIDTFIEKMADHLTERLDEFHKGDKDDMEYIGGVLKDFFKKPITPTLTEDERVILRNIDTTMFTHIGREPKNSIYDLYLCGENIRSVEIDDILKPSLFQFIKERRRI